MDSLANCHEVVAIPARRGIGGRAIAHAVAREDAKHVVHSCGERGRGAVCAAVRGRREHEDARRVGSKDGVTELVAAGVILIGEPKGHGDHVYLPHAHGMSHGLL